jgi:ABC-2 type transport system ATP-binding protein
LRLLLGLSRPSAGRVVWHAGLAPAHVGVALGTTRFHPGRTGRNGLRAHAAALGLPDDRVDAVLARVGMLDVGDRRAREYSLGMVRRLELAHALIGSPKVLVLDEPANGLDPEGIRWLRDLLRAEAGSGVAVLLSSHLLPEVARTVDDIVILTNGRVRYRGPLDGLLEGTGRDGPRDPIEGAFLALTAAAGKD